jgi:UPF0755 protein
MKRFAAGLLLLALLGAAGAAMWLQQPFAAFHGDVFVDIPKGSSTRKAARLLADAGVIRYPWMLLAARFAHPKSPVQAGEYKFDHAASAIEVLTRLARGDVFYYELTVPEGSNMFDIAGAASQFGTFSREDFLKEAGKPDVIHDLAPEARTLEGYLFPATYRLGHKTTAAQLCKEMTDRFRRAWKTVESTTPVHRAVTMASLVEKETGVPAERPVVAAVFENRLQHGMKLECDPTTVYAALLESRYRGTIFKSDLDSQNPYNTYQHLGLPPGPIANPGLASLKAAVHPAQTDYLYFVAKPGGAGGHQFSKDLAAHQLAVAAYRRGNQPETAPTPKAAQRASRSGKPHAR